MPWLSSRTGHSARSEEFQNLSGNILITGDSVYQRSQPALQRLKVSVFLKLQDDFRYFVVEVTALLDGDGIRLLGKGFTNLREVAVLVILIFHFTRVVDEGELPCQIVKNSLEAL